MLFLILREEEMYGWIEDVNILKVDLSIFNCVK
jgi:hypothetical protein